MLWDTDQLSVGSSAHSLGTHLWLVDPDPPLTHSLTRSLTRSLGTHLCPATSPSAAPPATPAPTAPTRCRRHSTHSLTHSLARSLGTHLRLPPLRVRRHQRLRHRQHRLVVAWCVRRVRRACGRRGGQRPLALAPARLAALLLQHGRPLLSRLHTRAAAPHTHPTPPPPPARREPSARTGTGTDKAVPAREAVQRQCRPPGS
jgi:hypothetical protein